MPPIASRIRPHAPESLTPARVTPNPQAGTSTPPPTQVGVVQTPTLNTVLRCPLPNIITPSSDSLRQYYAGGLIPQYRFVSPPPLS